MKRFLPLSCLTLLVACGNPAGPSREALPSVPSVQGADGAVSSKQITIERIRLRRAMGPDFATSLTNGQVIDVPVNTNLDIWAEIRRLETDRARLLVDWGNGNSDFSSCGSCRLENLYKEQGRYTVTIKVIDLNAPTGSETITSLTVILNVIDSSAAEAGLSCAGVSADVESLATGNFPRVATGFTVSSVPLISFLQGRIINDLVLPNFPFTLTSGRVFHPRGPMTIEFTSDKNFVSLAFHHTNLLPIGNPSANPISFKAFNLGGQQVLSGSKTGTIVTWPGTIEDTLTISGATFRKVVISADEPLYYPFLVFDNLQAGCR